MRESPPTPEDLTRRLIAFRDARDWRRFHSLKNLIVSLNLESSELLELTQWRRDEEVEDLMDDEAFRGPLADECADIYVYLLLIAERVGFDLATATAAKIEKNEAKYPVEKSQGSAKKYTEL